MSASARVGELALQLERLRAEHNELRFEVAALCSCLERKGLLRPVVRREHFESLESVLEAAPVASSRAWGATTWEKLRCASRGLRDSLDAVQAKKLHVLGGQTVAHPLEHEHVLHSWECFSLRGTRGGGTWEAQQPFMDCTRAAHAGAAFGGWLYICGGSGPYTGLARSVVKLNPMEREKRWRHVTPMNKSRYNPVAAAVGQRLYVCGGHNHQQALSCMEALLPSGGRNGTGEWQDLPSMSEPRSKFAGVALRAQFVVFGGTRGHPNRLLPSDVSNSVEAFVPSERRWRRLPPMERGRFYHTAVEYRGIAYVCGGVGVGGEQRFVPLDAMRCYDPSTNSWTAGQTMLRPRFAHAAATVAGRLYVCGGFLQHAERAGATVERLALSDAGTWQPVQSMAQGRAEFCAVALPTGPADRGLRD